MEEGGCSYASWRTLRMERDPSVPVQVGETCGHCAIRMLLADAGLSLSAEQIVDAVGHADETTAGDLVRVLNTRNPGARWTSRLESEEQEADRRFALYFEGWWIGMIKEFGRLGHWVVVRGCGDEGVLEVRDSADGTRCWVVWSEFEVYWTRITVRPV